MLTHEEIVYSLNKLSDKKKLIEKAKLFCLEIIRGDEVDFDEYLLFSEDQNFKLSDINIDFLYQRLIFRSKFYSNAILPIIDTKFYMSTSKKLIGYYRLLTELNGAIYDDFFVLEEYKEMDARSKLKNSDNFEMTHILDSKSSQCFNLFNKKKKIIKYLNDFSSQQNLIEKAKFSCLKKITEVDFNKWVSVFENKAFELSDIKIKLLHQSFIFNSNIQPQNDKLPIIDTALELVLFDELDQSESQLGDYRFSTCFNGDFFDDFFILY